MSDEKGFKLIEAVTSLEGVVACEVYKKSTGENVWDILVSTENGRLIEQTLSSKEDGVSVTSLSKGSRLLPTS